MDYSQPENTEKRIIIIIAVITVCLAVTYAGYHKFMRWHENKIQTAAAVQQQKLEKKNTELEDRMIALRNQLETLQPPKVSDDRLTEVFGTPEVGLSAAPDHSCAALKKKIASFFNYVQQNSEAGTNPDETDPSALLLQTVRALSANPPMIAEETRDMVNLKHNEAHFFRILGKNRIKQIRAILTAESDVLEHAMADFYAYYVTEDCCKRDDEPCVSLTTLYTYAGFFMNTFAGKSYLFRRDSAVRCLTDYYAVRILDLANDAGMNRYGIDIRPCIEIAIDNIASQNNLIFRDQYLATLTELQKKYTGQKG